jgi:hypothetical protein
MGVTQVTAFVKNPTTPEKSWEGLFLWELLLWSLWGLRLIRGLND